jgi:hypothetical protein
VTTTPVIAIYSEVDGIKVKDELHSSCAKPFLQTWRLSFNILEDGSVGPHACVRGFLFLFLPRKEKVNPRIPYVSEMLSLKASGWGPPDDQISSTNQLERVQNYLLRFIVTNSY